MRYLWKGKGNITVGSELFPPNTYVELPESVFESLDADVKVLLEAEEKPEEFKRKPGRPKKESVEE